MHSRDINIIGAFKIAIAGVSMLRYQFNSLIYSEDEYFRESIACSIDIRLTNISIDTVNT